MALSSAILTAFSCRRSAFFLNPSTSSFRLQFLPTLRLVTTVTSATASSQQQERPLRGIMKPTRVTPEMADFVGSSEIPRTQALKIIWAYIKEHNLQDPDNKKIILCDEKLKKIFSGKDRVDFLEVARLMSPHFLK